MPGYARSFWKSHIRQVASKAADGLNILSVIAAETHMPTIREQVEKTIMKPAVNIVMKTGRKAVIMKTWSISPAAS